MKIRPRGSTHFFKHPTNYIQITNVNYGLN